MSMNLDEEMKALKKIGSDGASLPSPQKMAMITAAALDQAATSTALTLFNDKTYIKLTDLSGMNQLEQDRILNELILAGIIVIMLTLEAPDLRTRHDLKEYFRLLKDEVPKAHLTQLKELGIEKKHIKLWKKLIEMRYDEYVRERLDARSAAMEYESQEKPLTAADLDGIHMYLPAFTVAVGCHHHIFRGKTEGYDLAFKYLMKKLSRFYVTVRATLEGGHLTPVNRARVLARHFINDVKDWWEIGRAGKS
ncbi:hypothetical protein HYU89_04315 [Candidatus Collierbacteria bacterium]|nr:hypothetical protein [Candidatus Collierbacteria bacterium]